MKLTYYVPTTEQGKEHLCLEVRQLFEVELIVIQRATDIQLEAEDEEMEKSDYVISNKSA